MAPHDVPNQQTKQKRFHGISIYLVVLGKVFHPNLMFASNAGAYLLVSLAALPEDIKKPAMDKKNTPSYLANTKALKKKLHSNVSWNFSISN